MMIPVNFVANSADLLEFLSSGVRIIGYCMRSVNEKLPVFCLFYCKIGYLLIFGRITVVEFLCKSVIEWQFCQPDFCVIIMV